MDYQATLTQLRKQGLYRELDEVEGPQDAAIVIQGQPYLNFSSNNYLGLATDPRLAAAAAAATDRYGWGAGSAALISGQMSPHEQLRRALGAFFSAEAALLFNSGYHANVGAIPALVGPSDLLFSDALNHASLIDGCRLARCPTHIYRHGDTDHLAELLEQHPATGERWIITESVFSMDGDQAPLEAIAQLATQYNANIYLDEAHAVGVFGEQGRGLWETVETPLAAPNIIRMGTFGKALGSYGAFVLGSSDSIEYLLNRARTFIYTTALPPAVTAVNHCALEIVATEPERQMQLWQHVHHFADELEIKAESPIIPWIIPGNEEVVTAGKKLRNAGFLVRAIRSPTVPVGKERLRITLSAMHTEEQVEKLINAIKTI